MVLAMETQRHGMLPSMATPRARGLATAADIEDERQEVVDGELVRKASPSFAHSSTQGLLCGALSGFHQFVGNPGGWWLGTEVEIELAPHEVYLPDIAGWRVERVPEPPRERPVRIAPDWACEVLSPSTTGRDLGHKRHAYHQARVGHLWIADPREHVLLVCRWHENGYLLVLAGEAGASVRVEPFDAVELDLAKIFGPPTHAP
jgi:Uma2 family endonuclease